jgi:hypothetical protein
MPRLTTSRLNASVLLALAAVLLTSCGKKPPLKPVFSVSGKLVDGGQPAGRALIFFHPVGAHGQGTLRPVAKVAADGTFRVSTYAANDGAPAGEYALAVVWPDVPKDAPADWDEGPDRLKGRCSKPQSSPWKVRVEDQPKDLGTLDLRDWPKPVPGAKPVGKEPLPGLE